MNHDSSDADLTAALVAYLAAAEVPADLEDARNRIISALRNERSIDPRFAQAVRISVKLVPRGRKGCLGMEGFLLNSISREYREEYALMHEALERVLSSKYVNSTAHDASSWLEDALRRAVRENWCMNRSCTTCGSFQMVELLTGEKVPGTHAHQKALREMTWARAKEIINGLHHCSAQTSPEAIMWMLHRLWLRWGDRAHEELFPELDGTFAGEVLARMRIHYAQVLQRQSLHAARQGVKTSIRRNPRHD